MTNPTKTILLVEDNPVIALSESAIIEHFGYHVLTAHTGENAVQIITGNSAVDLILMDIDLGAGIDGPEAARQILEKHNLPVVFLTGHSERAYVDRVREITRYGYVLKNSGDFVLRSSIEMAFELFDAREKSSEKERDLRKTQSLTRIGSWFWNLNLSRLTISDELYRILGINKETAGDSLADLIVGSIHPDDVDRVNRSISSFIRKKKLEPIECRIVGPESEVRTVIVVPDVLHLDELEVPQTLSGYVQDISDRKQIEQELLKQNKLMTTILENSPIGFAVNTIDDGNVIFVSRNFEKIYGIEHGDVQGVNDFFEKVYADPVLREELRARISSDMKSGDPSRMRWDNIPLTTRHGGKKVISASNILVPGHNLMVSTVQDVTQWSIAEQELREHKAELETAQRIAGVGSWTWDLLTNSVEWSDEAFRLFGVTPGSHDGSAEYLLRIVHPEDRDTFLSSVRRSIRSDEPSTIEYRIIHADGSVHHMLTEFRTRFDQAGEARMSTGTVRDITEQKESEEKIRTLLAEKDLILREVHHRIKNNMAVMGSLLSLQANSINDSVAVEALMDARNRLRSMGLLYDKLFLSEAFTEVSVQDYLPTLAEEVVKTFDLATSVTIENTIDDFMLPVKALTSVGIIMNELIINVMKHAFVGMANGILTISAKRKGNHILIGVADNGIGIPDSLNIEQSSGFGLMLVQAFAKQLNGNLQVERGAGARFTLEFEG